MGIAFGHCQLVLEREEINFLNFNSDDLTIVFWPGKNVLFFAKSGWEEIFYSFSSRITDMTRFFVGRHNQTLKNHVVWRLKTCNQGPGLFMFMTFKFSDKLAIRQKGDFSPEKLVKWLAGFVCAKISKWFHCLQRTICFFICFCFHMTQQFTMNR